MQDDLECEGKIKLGSLTVETRQRLTQLSGHWLEFSPEENSIVVRHVQPTGCPALSAVPCELMNYMESISPAQRNAVPGGVLYVKDDRGQTLRISVKASEVRIQWPWLDYSRPVKVTPEEAMALVNSKESCVCGWARFAGSNVQAGELQRFVDCFEGLYPEGDLSIRCEEEVVHVHFDNVNVGPRQLVSKLRDLASPPESLQVELDVTSFAPGSEERSFRIRIEDGRIDAVRPTLW